MKSTSSYRKMLAVTMLLVSGCGFVASGRPSAAQSLAGTAFESEGSDPRALELADRVMERLGGELAWQRTRFITWNFFGRRRHVWDKHTGDIRVEGARGDDKQPYLVLMNLGSGSGRAWIESREVTDPETLTQLLDAGEAAWINDSYWMFMPYKLKDPGVRLEYLGRRTMLDGRPSEALQLTFRDVGRTPENKYHVYVAEDSGLVEQWDFFPKASDSEPRFRLPWRNWQRYGEILLSDDRGDSRHSDIAVFEQLPEHVLSRPESVDWHILIP